MRQPNTWLMENKLTAQIVLCATALGGLGSILMTSSLMDKIGLFLMGSAFLAWLYLENQTSPKVSDYIEFLETATDKMDHGFVEKIQTEFKEIWQIDDMVEVFD